MRLAAHNTMMDPDAVNRLDAAWLSIPVWSGARELLQSLAPHCKLAVVTNCSVTLGKQAANRLNIAWDAIITSEEAGYYKPDPRPYQMALDRLGVKASDAAFIAGSGYDLFGTEKVGLRTFWHNRVGLTRPEGAPLPEVESQTFIEAMPWLQTFKSQH